MMIVSDYGFNVTATREASINYSNKSRLSELLSSVYLVKILLTAGCYLIIFIFSQLASWTWDKYFLYTVTFSSFAFQSLTPFWFFQGLKKNFLSTAVNFFSKIILVVLALWQITPGTALVVASEVEWSSYLFSFASCNIIILMILKVPLTRPNKEMLVKQLKSGKDIFIATVINWSITGGSLFVLKYFATPEEMGYYGTFTRIVYYAYAIMQPANLAFFPYISSKFSESFEGGLALMKKLSRLYFIALAGLCIAGILSSKLFYELFFDSYFLSRLPHYLLVFYILFLWVCLVLINNFIGLQCLVAMGKDNVYRRYYSLNAIIAIVGFVSLIPSYSTYGAAISIFTGELVLSIILIRFFLKLKSNSPTHNSI